jgi:hypothetical protein
MELRPRQGIDYLRLFQPTSSRLIDAVAQGA